MLLSDHQYEFLKDLAQLVHYASRRGIKITGGELYRPPATQLYFKERGKSQLSQGYHQQRLAVDLNILHGGKFSTDPDDYLPLGDHWESLSALNVWGGRWESLVDPFHFERRV